MLSYIAQECKVDPNDVLASDIANPAQVYDGVANDDVGDTQEGVNPTRSW